MSADWLAATLDSVYMLWLWLPGIAWAAVWGFRNWIDKAVIGFIVSALVANLTFLVMYVVGQAESFVPVVRSILLMAFIGAALLLRARLSSVLAVSGLAVTVVGFAAILRNILRVDGWLISYDHIVTAIAAHFIQSGQLGEQTISEAIYKKGLTFPIVLALGRDDLLLGVTPVVVFILLLAATYRVIDLILDTAAWPPRLGLWGVSVALWGTSEMFWGYPFYQHGHVIVALGIAAYTTLIFQYLKNPTLSWRLTSALVVTGIVLTQSRFEAFILVFFLSLPILWSLRAKSVNWRGILHAVAISLAWPVGFSVWIGALGNFPVSGISIWLISVMSFVGAVIVATVLYGVPGSRYYVIHFVWATLLGSTVAFLFFAREGEDWSAFYANTFQGEGQWGSFWWVPVLAIVFLTVSKKTSVEALVVWLTVVIILLTILVKITDGFPLGRLGRIRTGWGDSVNRTLFHAFPLVTAIVAVSLHKIFRTLRSLFGPGPGSRKKS